MLDPYYPKYNSIIVYIILLIAILTNKPDFMYDHTTQRFKKFGINDNETIFSLPCIMMFCSIVIYTFFLFVKLLIKK